MVEGGLFSFEVVGVVCRCFEAELGVPFGASAV